jgi:hypothetical protein
VRLPRCGTAHLAHELDAHLGGRQIVGVREGVGLDADLVIGIGPTEQYLPATLLVCECPEEDPASVR